MEMWTAIGTGVAAAAAIWAVVVSHRANKIAKESVPQRFPAFEGKPVAPDRWRFTNVGRSTLFGAVLVEMIENDDDHDSGEPIDVVPGGHIDIDLGVVPMYRRVQVRGYELRDGVRVERAFDVA